MANEEHVAIIKQGVEGWNKWRAENPSVIPDLSGANFFSADLSMADLSGALLFKANLDEAVLRGATLINAMCSYTDFGNVDLSQVKGLDTVDHYGPSYIDIQTVYKSGGNIPEAFVRGAGVPAHFIPFMESLTCQAFDFYSCFISHSSKDEEFVKRLLSGLLSNGVDCFYAPNDLEIGEPVVSGIDRGIRSYDKLLLILSENSVESWWVEHEVQSALSEEKSRKARLLFPIRLDNSILDTPIPWANTIRARQIGDFTGWKDYGSYQEAFDRLLRDLKGKS